MYCGDETGSFIGDIGSYASRFGYGGEDSPKYVVPSYTYRCRNGGDEEDKDGADDTGSNSGEKNGGGDGGDDARVSMKSRRRRRRGYVATSCYSYRPDREYSTALRMAESPSASAAVSSTACEPIVDPNLFLQQGDSYQDWDAVETLWQSAFDAMRVGDRYKHTKGGDGHGGFSGDSAGGPKAATTTKHSGRTKSSTIKSSSESGEGKCVHPLLVVSPGYTHRVGPSKYDESAHTKELVQLTELMMETFDCQSMFVAPSPMLAAFSHGRRTALVVDIGASGTKVTPVVDGLVLKQSQRRSGRGGDWLGNVQWHALLQDKSIVRPRYQAMGRASIGASAAAASPASSLFHRWAMQDLMYEFRTSGNVQFPPWTYDTSVPFLYDDDNDEQDMNGGSGSSSGSNNSSSEDEDDDKSGSGSGGNNNNEDDDDDDDAMEVEEEETSRKAAAGKGKKRGTKAKPPPFAPLPAGGGADAMFELPDGTLIDLTSRVGKDMCRVPELFFAEQLPFLSSDTTSNTDSILQQHASLSNLPLPQLIYSSLSAVADVDARKELAGSILLTGGSSLFPNLEQRLSYSLPLIVSSAYKCKVSASQYSIERTCAPWIGGSILSSLGSFQQLWLSRAEYEEYGATLAVQRFP